MKLQLLRQIILGWFICALSLSCRADDCHKAKPAVTEKECLELIKQLPYWTFNADGPKDFSKGQWSQFIECAKAFQRLNPEERLNILNDFQRYCKANPTNNNRTGFTWCKCYLMLRIAFNVTKKSGVKSGMGLIGDSGDDPLWPLSLNEAGQFSLIAVYRGSMGPPYSAVEDYNNLLKHFSFREF